MPRRYCEPEIIRNRKKTVIMRAIFGLTLSVILSISMLLVFPTRASGPPRSNVPQVAATSLSSSLGVNVHENYLDTAYVAGGSITGLVNSISALGVHWIRIGIKKQPPPFERSFLTAVRAHGVKVLGIVGALKSEHGDFSLGDAPSLITALTRGPYSGLVDALELPNEADTAQVTDWRASLRTFNSEYVAALQGNLETARLPIVGASVAALDNCAYLSGAPSAVQYFNVHPYSPAGELPENSISARTCANTAQTDLPLIATEFGWTNDATDKQQGLSESATATYLVRSLLWNRMQGIRSSFIYELYDQVPDSGLTESQWHFGLVRVTGVGKNPSAWTQSRKPAFVDISRLASLLRYGGPATDKSLTTTLKHTGSSTIALRIKHANGSVDLAFWLKAAAASTESHKFRVSFGKGRASCRVFNVASGRWAVRTTRQTSVNVLARSTVKFLRCTPN